MDIDQRIEEAQSKYAETQKQRNQLIEQSNNLLREMDKLEGEFNALVKLKESSKPKKSKKADTIEVTPEKEG